MPIYFLDGGSGEGGGEELPTGTIAFFEKSEVTPDWITQGIYDKGLYTELSQKKGYPDASSEVASINDAVFETYPSSMTVGGFALQTVAGDKQVYIRDNDSSHYIVNSNNVTGLTLNNGAYFTPALTITDFAYPRAVMNHSDGNTYMITSNTQISCLDINLQSNTVCFDLNNIAADGKTRTFYYSTSSLVGGKPYSFTKDNRIVALYRNSTDMQFELFVSNPGERENGDIIVVSNQYSSGIVLGVGISEGVNGDVYWCGTAMDSNNRYVFSVNKDGLNSVVDETSSFHNDIIYNPNGYFSVCGNHECDTVMISTSQVTTTSNPVYFQRISGGDIVSSIQTPGAAQFSTLGMFPVAGSGLAWYFPSVSALTTNRYITFDNGFSFNLLPNTDLNGIATVVYSKQYGVLGFAGNDASDDFIMYNDITQTASNSFLVQPLPELFSTHEARHKT